MTKFYISILAAVLVCSGAFAQETKAPSTPSPDGTEEHSCCQSPSEAAPDEADGKAVPDKKAKAKEDDTGKATKECTAQREQLTTLLPQLASHRVCCSRNHEQKAVERSAAEREEDNRIVGYKRIQVKGRQHKEPIYADDKR